MFFTTTLSSSRPVISCLFLPLAIEIKECLEKQELKKHLLNEVSGAECLAHNQPFSVE